ncbi:sugar ABC transporter substrate-binding protein [Leucobacter sp. HY1910]
MKKNLLAAAAAAMAAVLALAGCSGQDGAAPSEAASGTVRFVATDDPSSYDAVIAAFEKAHPDVKIEYSQIPFDQYSSTIQQRIGAKDETIDIYAVDQPRLAQLAAQGYLEDLSALDESTKSAVSDVAYNVSVYDGKLYALPITTSTQLLFYNKDLLDAANLSYPSSDVDARATWEEIAENGAAVQQTGAKYGLLLEQPDSYYQIQPLVESAGGGSGFTGDDNLGVDVTNKEWVEAMDWFADIFDSGLSARGIGIFQTNAVFADGNVAYFVGGTWNLANFDASEVNWGVAPMPYFNGGTVATPTGSWSLGLNPASPNKAAAQEFMEYMALDAEGSYLTSESVANLPANTAALEQTLPNLDALAGERSAGAGDIVGYEANTTAVPRPVSVGFPQFEDAINKAIADIRNGSDVTARLGQAQQEITDVWARLK